MCLVNRPFDFHSRRGFNRGQNCLVVTLIQMEQREFSLTRAVLVLDGQEVFLAFDEKQRLGQQQSRHDQLL